MTEPEILADLPEHLHQPAAALLEAFADQPVHKRRVLIETLHLLAGHHDTADMKMMANVINEIRRGLNVFAPYKPFRKASIFGSARIGGDDPRYRQTRDCARALTEAGFMIITGGGGGMMRAANEGAGADQSFGININLPMEQFPNPFVDGSPRHFFCKYFFTRKLFFLKESDAVILTPGGFGTLDETFETLTLLQTGRNPPVPVVLLEAPDDDYWGPFLQSWMRQLVNDRLISPDDFQLLFHTDSVASAVEHITDFYSNYHSFRYVGDMILLRILNPLGEEALGRLNAEFADVLNEGTIEQVLDWPNSDDACYAHLPRLRMHLDRGRMNVLPMLIRRMNALSARGKRGGG
ncbi:MAG TPA: LOG family protein [Mariprofundaceae bacterium]|nr:LOG family protein [Mariprofundaceae bacterium]